MTHHIVPHAAFFLQDYTDITILGFEVEGKISWLVVWKTTHYTRLKAMYDDTSWLLKNVNHFDRMAIVGDKKWEEILIKADSLVFGEKYFDISQLEEAWQYIEGTS